MKIEKSILLLALMIVIVCGLVRWLPGCDPFAFMPVPIFINTLHPDLPIMDFSKGNLGVIQPAYGGIYLLAAYRNLTGRPLGPAAQSAFWGSNQILLTGQAESIAQQLQSRRAAAQQPETDWIGEWISETGIIPTGATPTDQFGPGGGVARGIYSQVSVHVGGSVLMANILNCPDGAFRTALSTLQTMKSRFGTSSPVVNDWLQAQQLVFDKCDGLPGEIPSPLPRSAPELARANRAYQIAAAHFYAGNYDQAAAEFRAIGQNPSSSWSRIAPYLVARALVRKATVNSFRPDLSVLAEAETQLDEVLADPRQSKYHHAAEQLRGFVEFRLHPAERLAGLSNLLSRPRGDADLAQEATDFKLLFKAVTHKESWGAPPPLSAGVYSSLANARAKSGALDWMLTLRIPSAGSEHAFETWQSSHSPAWLVAALTTATADSPHLAELISAASQVPRASPAYVSATFQSLRLMMLNGKKQAVRKRLAQLPIDHLGPFPPEHSTPRSAINQFLALRFKLARDSSVLFANAPRIAATITDADSSRQMPQPVWLPNHQSFDANAARLDGDGLIVFNRLLPVAVLVQASRSAAIPKELREEIALAAWTRAALLDNAPVARALIPALEASNPGLKASLESYSAARSPAARRFAAVLAMLRFPGLRPFITTPERWTPLDQIDDYRDNWWGTLGPVCAPPNAYSGRPGYPPPPQWPQLGPALVSLYPGGQVHPPWFLTKRQNEDAAREWRELLADSPAPDYFARQTISWARANPSDPRAAEALARAVKATRVGCVNQATGALSKAAFDLLHQRYPESKWARDTKYWFSM